MKCFYKDCQNQATHAVKIYIPPSGYPALKENSLAMIAGLKMCRRHCEATEPQEFVPDLEKIAEMMARLAVAQKGGVFIPPDCVRAWVVAIPLEGEEFKSFERMSEGRKTN